MEKIGRMRNRLIGRGLIICLLLLFALLPTVLAGATSGKADSVYFHIKLDTLGGLRVGRVLKLTYALVNSPFDSVSAPVFNDSIENNIKFGKPDATHDEVVAAARAARCHDFISALPEGYDTVIGEGGATLSGGERQRLSIARAMLKDAPIVILDEATANVDPENEADLQEAIEALTGGKTIIMIAHRLKTVRRANQILVLEHGRITQRGTHEQLIQEPGIYADFIQVRQRAANWKIS